jgi:hypothetical protein
MVDPIFSEAVLREERARQSFDLVAHVLHRIEVRHPGGRLEEVWLGTGDWWPARLAPVSSDEPLVHGRPSPRDRYYLVLPWEASVPRDARLDVASEDGWLLTVDVIGARTPRSYQVLTKLVVEAVWP